MNRSYTFAACSAPFRYPVERILPLVREKVNPCTRNLQLDVLRGVAILLVVGAHMRLKPPDGVVGLFGKIWHDFGGFGVPLFFTLSGYLVGGLLLTELRKRGSISVKRFLVRRGLKIYPAYFVFLAYLVVMPTMKSLASGKDALSVITALFHDYLPNVFFLQNYVGPTPLAIHGPSR